MASALFDLSGKTALITGATRGLGRAIAQAFGEAGARLVIASENVAECAATEAELRTQGFDTLAVPCDVTNSSDLESLVAASERQGGIDVLVCNAGISGPAGPLHQLDETDYEAIFAVNLHSVVRLTCLAIPKMAARGGGSVILMSSIAGLRGNKAIGAYALTKAALAQLARNYAVEWGPSNVRSNAISPGLIRTGFSTSIIEDAEYFPRRMAMTPLRRVGEPREIAAAALFLASPGGAFVNGHNLVVDGGTVITDGN